jgi:hypothetical protein
MLEMNQRMERMGRELARGLKGLPWDEAAAALSYVLQPIIEEARKEERRLSTGRK